MKATAVNKKRVGRQHPDHNQRPDSGVIWLDELVKDAKHPDRISFLPFCAATLWRTIAEGTFPKPVCKRGWRIGDVREWKRTWDGLQLPTTDSAQTTAKLFAAAPLSTRGSTIGSVRRVPRPGVAPVTAGCDTTTLDAPVHRQVDAAGEVSLAQVKSCPPTDAAPTESTGSAMAGEPYDVSLLLNSIFQGATA